MSKGGPSSAFVPNLPGQLTSHGLAPELRCPLQSVSDSCSVVTFVTNSL